MSKRVTFVDWKINGIMKRLHTPNKKTDANDNAYEAVEGV